MKFTDGDTVAEREVFPLHTDTVDEYRLRHRVSIDELRQPLQFRGQES